MLIVFRQSHNLLTLIIRETRRTSIMRTEVNLSTLRTKRPLFMFVLLHHFFSSSTATILEIHNSEISNSYCHIRWVDKFSFKLVD